MSRFKGFSGPIGSGKSQALCHEAIKLSFQNPGRVGLLGAPTYPMLRDATQTALLRILDLNGLPYKYHRSENVLTMQDTGSRILLRSLEEYERLRGTNLAWFGVDELTYSHPEAWQRLEGRLRDPAAVRLCGFAVWTPQGHDWVYKRFLADPPDGYETVIAKAMENRFILDKIPDFYERLRKSYDEKFYRQEVLGEYLNIQAGRVYHAFDREVHLEEMEVDPYLPLLWALDFNVDPMCSVIAQYDGETVRVLDEIVLGKSTTWEACEEFLTRYPQHEEGLMIYGDASGNARQTGGASDYSIVARYMARTQFRQPADKVPKANPRVGDRVGAMNAMLKSAAGNVRMRIDPRCKELILDLEEMRYKDGSSQLDKDSDKRRSHLSDALGYLVYQETRVSKQKQGHQNRPLV